MTEISRGY